jgi:hypothetical protein
MEGRSRSFNGCVQTLPSGASEFHGDRAVGNIKLDFAFNLVEGNLHLLQFAFQQLASGCWVALAAARRGATTLMVSSRSACCVTRKTRSRTTRGCKLFCVFIRCERRHRVFSVVQELWSARKADFEQLLTQMLPEISPQNRT